MLLIFGWTSISVNNWLQSITHENWGYRKGTEQSKPKRYHIQPDKSVSSKWYWGKSNLLPQLSSNVRVKVEQSVKTWAEGSVSREKAFLSFYVRHLFQLNVIQVVQNNYDNALVLNINFYNDTDRKGLQLRKGALKLQGLTKVFLNIRLDILYSTQTFAKKTVLLTLKINELVSSTWLSLCNIPNKYQSFLFLVISLMNQGILVCVFESSAQLQEH